MDQTIVLIRHAERTLMELFCKETIIPCMNKWKRVTQFDVYNTKKGEHETVRARDINNAKLLQKFFESDDARHLDPATIENIGQKVDSYSKYLIETYKKRYQYIKSDGQLQAFRVMVIFTMVLRSMEWMHVSERLKDKGVKQRVERMLVRRAENAAFSKAYGHEKKHGEDGTFVTAIAEFQGRVNDTFLPPYEDDLPELPPGVVNPVMWLIDEVKQPQIEMGGGSNEQ